MGLITRGFEEMTAAMTLFNDAVMEAISSFSEIFARYEVVEVGIPGWIGVRDKRDGSVIVSVDPALPHPTQSGVEALRSPQSVPGERQGLEASYAWVDETHDMPLDLPDRMVEVVNAELRKEGS